MSFYSHSHKDSRGVHITTLQAEFTPYNLHSKCWNDQINKNVNKCLGFIIPYKSCFEAKMN